MSDTVAQAETPATPSPSDPAPQATANGQDAQSQVESNAPPGSEPGAPQAANPSPDGQLGDEAEKARKRQTAQERINEINAKYRSEQRKAGELQAEIERLKQLQPPPANAPLEEQDDYRLKRVVRSERVEQLESEVAQARNEAWGSVVAAARAKAEAAADRMPDLVTKLQSLPKLSPETVHFIAESEKGAEVAYHLANNPAEAARIAELDRFNQGIELTRLEGKCAVPPPVRKVSTAPSPVPTVTGNPSPSGKTLEDMSVADMQAKLYGKKK